LIGEISDPDSDNTSIADSDQAVLEALVPSALVFLSSDADGHAGVSFLVNRRYAESRSVSPVHYPDFPGRALSLVVRQAGDLEHFAVHNLYNFAGVQRLSERFPAFVDYVRRHRPVAPLELWGGDWNFTEVPADRWGLLGSAWASPHEKVATTFRQELATPLGLMEAFQPDMTFVADSKLFRSRIDRWYTTMRLADELTSRCEARTVKLPRLLQHYRRPDGSTTRVSDHAPVLLQLGQTERSQLRRFPQWISRDPRYASLVQHFYEDAAARSGTGRPDQAAADLARLKLAMWTAADTIRGLDGRGGFEKPATLGEQFGMALSVYRAMSDGSWQLNTGSFMRKLALIPRLHELVHVFFDVRRRSWRLSADLEAVRTLVESLALRKEDREFEDAVIRARQAPSDRHKRSRAEQLKRIRPCFKEHLTHLDDPAGSGESTVQGDRAAEWVAAYWGPVWSRRNVQPQRAWTLAPALRDRLRDFSFAHVTVDDFKRAIRLSGNAFPGPDRLPFAAWRGICDLGAEVLFRVFQMIRAGGDPPADLGHSVLFLLPKVPYAQEPVARYRPQDCRPISCGNADARLYATVLKDHLEPAVNGPGVVPMPHAGPLAGRDILGAVEPVNSAFYSAMAEAEPGILLLNDFREAFPRTSHDAIAGTLRFLGLAICDIALIMALYFQWAHWLLWRGAFFRTCGGDSGLRQGCPLSALLLVLVMLPLTWALRDLCGSQSRGSWRMLWSGFADDLAIFMHGAVWFTALPELDALFRAFAAATGLEVNPHKCKILRTWKGWREPATGRRWDLTRGTVWAGVDDVDKASHLGFVLGRAATVLDNFAKPVDKFYNRLIAWAGVRLGRASRMFVANVHVQSVLSYVGRAFLLPPELASQLARALKRFIVGGASVPFDVLCRLQACYRVGGTGLRHPAWSNLALVAANASPGCVVPVRTGSGGGLAVTKAQWARAPCIRVHWAAAVRRLRETLGEGAEPPSQAGPRPRCRLSRTLYGRLAGLTTGTAAAAEWLVTRIGRWGGDVAQVATADVARSLREAGKVVPADYVLAGFLFLAREWAFRWRRAKWDPAVPGLCLFCGTAADRPEHYAACPALAGALTKAGLCTDASLASQLLLRTPTCAGHPARRAPDDRFRSAWIAVYGLYRAHSFLLTATVPPGGISCSRWFAWIAMAESRASRHIMAQPTPAALPWEWVHGLCDMLGIETLLPRSVVQQRLNTAWASCRADGFPAASAHALADYAHHLASYDNTGWQIAFCIAQDCDL